MLESPSNAHRLRLTALLVAVVVGASVGAVLYFLLRPDDRPVRQDQPTRVPLIGEGRSVELDKGGSLLLDGEKVSLEEASQRAGFEVLRPDDAANRATDASIEEVWITTDGQVTVALKYGSGLTEILTAWPEGNPQTPESYYQYLVVQSSVGTVETINGNPAWVVRANAQGPGLPDVSTIVMSIGTVEVSLKADMSLKELREVAASIKATNGI